MSPARILLLCMSLAAAGAAQAAPTRPAASAGVPAEWRSYDLLLDFRDLPRTYSCDDLWYRFRDVLRALGARAYMTITPYHCGYAGGGEARSPSVEVKFQLPQPLHGAATRYAEVSAVSESVHLAPGAPHSLQPGDCELVRQMQELLLAALPVRVTAANFRCAGPGATFALTVQAPLATAAPARQAAFTGAAVPRS